MKGKLYWFVALIGGCALFLMSPLYGTYAYFTDTKTIDTALTLKLLSVTTNDVKITTNKLNTTVTGDVTATVSGFNGEVSLSLADDDATKWKDYFSIELPTLTNGQSQQIKVTKIKNLPASYNGALTLTIHDMVKLSDGSDVIVGSSTLVIKDTEDTSEEWPSDDKFQNNYFISQKIYFTTDTNGYYQQVNDGVIYINYTGTLSDDDVEKLKTGFTLDVSGTKYQLDVDIKVFAGKGFKVVLKKLKDSPMVKEDSLYLHMGGIKDGLGYIGFGRFAFRFLLNSDFGFNNSGVKLDTSIYTRSAGVVLNYATQQDSGGAKTLATLSNLPNYATWRVSDTDNFAITAQSDTSVIIKQNSSNGGKSATLQLVSKSDNKTVLFERQIVSVNEEVTETLKNEYEAMTAISPNTIYSYLLKEVTGASSITATARYNTTVKLVDNGKYYAIPIIFKITNEQGGQVKGFSTIDFAINYENNQSKGFWIGDSSVQTPYTKVYSADAQYLKVIVYKEVSTSNQEDGYLHFRLLTIPSDKYTESNSGNVRFGFYQLDLRAVRSLSQSRMMIANQSAVSEETTVSSNNVAETTTKSTAETIASSEEVQTTTETTTSTSSEETTSDPSTTSTTTDDTTETTTSSEETVASQ
ncbi:MAG: hypothetical protein ACLUQ0_00845 [Enterococcus italicus]|uniref:hypothetical protein n=1 Tax=Enterococcus italicus TaxID=246144 RepID=UPI003993AA4E